MQLIPTGDKVLVRADKPKKQTESGFHLVEEWKTLPPFGEVLAIGPLVTEVVPGDRVMFERYGSQIMENDERLLKESGILAVVTGE